MHRIPRTLLLCALASASIYGGACSSSSDPSPATTPDEGVPGLDDVVFEGDPLPTDEALAQLIAASPVTDAAKGAAFDAPTSGEKLPTTPAPTFAWHAGFGGSDAGPDAPVGSLSPRPARGRTAALLDLLGPERAALAHGTPLNGKAYFLVFSTPSDAKLVRVFTTKTTYQPDAAVWQKLQAVQGSITLTIETGIFDNDALASDGGPFQGEAVTFTVGG